ncbi:MAG: monofunctional biosynthetic peptidoglycan transglycosylase [Bacteroidetes bacterium]|nr:monofunctional biosynthetic peptidoglycan transglycosylase [Bacteroidota bacterium]
MRKLWRYIRNIVVGFLISSVAVALTYRFAPPPATPLMLLRIIEQAGTEKQFRFEKDWVSINRISPHLQLAVVAAEDQKFTDHLGFDAEAIREALQHNQKKKGKHGASTISQQTAKNVFLWPRRSWIRKGFESWFTILIEILWSKKRILEVYLNVVEMGEGIYGAEAAAQHYFGKSADKINRNEAALLAAILPGPRKWNPAKPTKYLTDRQQWILGQMNNLQKLNME